MKNKKNIITIFQSKNVANTIAREDFLALVSKISDLEDEIVDFWLATSQATYVIETLDTSIESFKRKYARNIFKNFIEISKGIKPPGDCPYMRKVVDLFKQQGLNSKEVYLSCTSLKNTILRYCFIERKHPKVSEEDTEIFYDVICEIFDMNLGNILSLYSSMMVHAEINLDNQRRIIEEHVALSRTDVDGVIDYVSDMFCRLCGYTKEELLGKTHSIIKHPDMPFELFVDMWDTIVQGKEWKGKVKNLKKDGGFFVANTVITPSYNESGKLDGYLAIRHDITDRIASQTDSLTKLANRRRFEEKLEQHFEKAMIEGVELSILLIDLDHFKKVNDTYGHDKGDEVLIALAKVMQLNIRKNDFCARWGGEEFAILLPETSSESAVKLAERIRKAVENISFGDFHTTCSIGVSIYQKGDSKESFFKKADANLYKAKESGRNRVLF